RGSALRDANDARGHPAHQRPDLTLTLPRTLGYRRHLSEECLAVARSGGPVDATGVRFGFAGTFALRKAVQSFAGVHPSTPSHELQQGVSHFGWLDGHRLDVLGRRQRGPELLGDTGSADTGWMSSDKDPYCPLPPQRLFFFRDAAPPLGQQRLY